MGQKCLAVLFRNSCRGKGRWRLRGFSNQSFRNPDLNERSDIRREKLVSHGMGSKILNLPNIDCQVQAGHEIMSVLRFEW